MLEDLENMLNFSARYFKPQISGNYQTWIHSLGTTKICTKLYINASNWFCDIFPHTDKQMFFLTFCFLLWRFNKTCPAQWFERCYSLYALVTFWTFSPLQKENLLTCELNLSWQTLQETCFLFAVGGRQRVWWRTAFCTGSIWRTERDTERLIKTVLMLTCKSASILRRSLGRNRGAGCLERLRKPSHSFLASLVLSDSNADIKN